ncbi:MAG TPA: hypothetical protein VL283_03380, partial [Candidatus Baltobacteraceae bacterium]|nr:hypothetical protein [Candidatus Baltobacteraceae bacterium]
LSRLAEDEGLTLKPYEGHQPGRNWWIHGLYGDSRDRDLCIQVVADEGMAAIFTADLKGYVRLYPRDGSNAWLLLESRRVEDMAALLTGVAEMTDLLRLACVWRMAHPTDPDPKA